MKYDTISCLNLLDRCDKPFSLLKQIKSSLKLNGYLIVAIVLPFKPYVEYNKDNRPSEQLPFYSSNYNNSAIANNNENIINEQITILVNNVFKTLDFELISFTRLPYLCEGNLAQSFYYLIDHVFIFKSV